MVKIKNKKQNLLHCLHVFCLQCYQQWINDRHNQNRASFNVLSLIFYTCQNKCPLRLLSQYIEDASC